MAKQTINIGASPNDGTGTPLRTAFDYCNLNFTELYTAVGPSGNNIVVPGNATITGDLGVGTASPSTKLEVATATANTRLRINSTSVVATEYFRSGTGLWLVGSDSTNAFKIARGSNFGGSADYFSIGSATADCTWFDAAGGTRMTLNSTGLGVGVSPTYKLDVSSSSNIVGRISSSSVLNTGFNITNTTGSTWSLYSFGSNDATLQNSFGIYHQNGTSFLQITQAGNVGIGVTPSAWGTGLKVLQVGARGYGSFFDFNNDVVAVTANLFWTGSTYSRISASSKYAVAYYQDIGSGAHQWLSSSAAGTNGVTPTMNTNMTLDASGNLLVGTTSSLPSFANGRIEVLAAASSYCIVADATATSAAAIGVRGNDSTVAASFYNASTGGTVGSIVINSGGVSYNTTSDYRLKESVKPISGGLARVNALKPSIYNWKSNGSTGEGFIAHELAEVVPFAVSGEKDAVNADGTIKSQGIDMSRIVPILVAAIQELTARVQTLEAK